MATLLNLCAGGSNIFFSLSLFPWRLYLQKDDKLLSPEKRSLIESTIQELALKLGIGKPVELLEKRGLICGSAQAQGVDSFNAKVGIVIDPDWIDQLPNAEFEYVLAHELVHIKKNDVIWLGVVSGIIGAIATLAISILFPASANYYFPWYMAVLFPPSKAALMGLAVSAIALVFFFRWVEERADKIAISVCSEAAQKAAPALFERVRQGEIRNRNAEGSYLSMLWGRLSTTEEGNYRIDIIHPSLTTRIHYLTPKMP